MNNFYSPLRYPGGKNCIFKFVSKLFYENSLIGINYAEPFAGGSGLALRLLFEGYVNQIFINDLDFSIYTFWKIILYRTTEFCNWIESVEVSIDNWKKYKEIQCNLNTSTEFEIAQSTFFLNRTNVSGVIKGGVIGGINQNGKYKMNARFKKNDLINRIHKIASMKERISLSNQDGIDFITFLNKKKENIFIYLDPPYFKKGSDLYMNFYSEEDHVQLAKNVHSLQKNWMVSYDSHDFILNLYSERDKIQYKLSQATSNRIGDEILIFSDILDYSNSISELKTPVSI